MTTVGPRPQAVAIVTGASSGIGAGCARALATTHSVGLVGRNVARLSAVAEELGDHAIAFVCDLSDPEAVDDLATRIRERFGTIDVLVNNAGTRPERLLTTAPFEQSVRLFNEQLRTNLLPAVHASLALVPLLRRPGGRIVNIGSIAAQTGGTRAGSVGYASAKAAVHGLSLGLSRELAPLGITVNTVAPGFVGGTHFTGDWTPEVIAPLVAATPTGRAGTPEDVAGAVAYLASPLAGMVTAQCLLVNGGAFPSR